MKLKRFSYHQKFHIYWPQGIQLPQEKIIINMITANSNIVVKGMEIHVNNCDYYYHFIHETQYEQQQK